MIKNGMYVLNALASEGAGLDAGGVLILRDGKIHGGDSYVYYVGTYACSKGTWSGQMTSQEHTPTKRPMAERVQQIEFSGSYNDDGAEVEATAVIGKHRIRYEATLRFLAAG